MAKVLPVEGLSKIVQVALCTPFIEYAIYSFFLESLFLVIKGYERKDKGRSVNERPRDQNEIRRVEGKWMEL